MNLNSAGLPISSIDLDTQTLLIRINMPEPAGGLEWLDYLTLVAIPQTSPKYTLFISLFLLC